MRSNHLSYRPPSRAGLSAAGGVSQLRLASPPMAAEKISRMKGHEDGGMFFGQEEERPGTSPTSYRHDP